MPGIRLSVAAALRKSAPRSSPIPQRFSLLVGTLTLLLAGCVTARPTDGIARLDVTCRSGAVTVTDVLCGATHHGPAKNLCGLPNRTAYVDERLPVGNILAVLDDSSYLDASISPALAQMSALMDDDVVPDPCGMEVGSVSRNWPAAQNSAEAIARFTAIRRALGATPHGALVQCGARKIGQYASFHRYVTTPVGVVSREIHRMRQSDRDVATRRAGDMAYVRTGKFEARFAHLPDGPDTTAVRTWYMLRLGHAERDPREDPPFVTDSGATRCDALERRALDDIVRSGP